MKIVVYRIKCEHGHYFSKDTEDCLFPKFDAVLIGDNKPPFWRRLTPEVCKLHLQLFKAQITYKH
jgi:hypothetical protein